MDAHDPRESNARIAALEAENRRLRAGFFAREGRPTVAVPEEMRALFDVAEQTVERYFGECRADPTRGVIEVAGERYVLLRASSLSTDFLDAVGALYADRGDEEALAIGRALLFDIAHTFGRSDARSFHAKTAVSDPIARLSAGPVHFAFTGWAHVDIHPSSRATPDENYCLCYDHLTSFEADAWLASGRRSSAPVCIMSAGYSSGWCTESFGVALTAVEVSCRARGDERCTFVMASPSRIAEHIAARFGIEPAAAAKKGLAIPAYFERKSVEDALRLSERRLRAILEAAPVPMFITRRSDRALVYVNAAACRLFGREREALEGGPFPPLFADEDAIATLLERARVHGEVTGVEMALTPSAEGASRWALAACRDLELPDGTSGALTTVVDISRQRHAERELRESLETLHRTQGELVRSERLASVGLLVAGVAHEVNTPLGVAVTAMSVLEEALGNMQAGFANGTLTRGDFRAALDRCAEAAGILSTNLHRAVAQVQSFKRVAVDQSDEERRVVELGGWLQETVASLLPMVRRADVEIHVEEPLSPVEIATFPGALVQVLTNFLSNAKQHAVVPERTLHVQLAVRVEGDEVVLEYRDDGRGMSPQVAARAFEPFYTTRRGGGGSGLGLHITRTLVEDVLGGRLILETAPDEGARFLVVLPRAGAPSAPGA